MMRLVRTASGTMSREFPNRWCEFQNAELGMIVDICNTGTQETETGELKLLVTLTYRMRFCNY